MAPSLSRVAALCRNGKPERPAVTLLSRDTELIQNAALGSIVQSRFVCGHCPKGADRRPVPMPLLFVVLPVILNQQIREQIERTQRRSGLRGFERRFLVGDARKEDLLGVQRRMLGMRALSLRSFRLALAAQLLHLEIRDGVIWPTSHVKIKNIPSSINRLLKTADKLGSWCADITLFEVVNILEIDV